MSSEFIISERGKPKRFSDASIVAAAAWSRAETTGAPTIIVYIHGRDIKLHGGDGEPRNSYREGIVAELEAAGATVVMLHWSHSIVPPLYTHMPIEDARAAGPALAALVRELASARPVAATAKTIVVTHSMGSIVLESAVLGTTASDWASVFRVIICSGASGVMGSKVWLHSLTCERYVTMNIDDGTLKKAANGGPFLGKQKASAFPETEIADGVFYLDVQDLDVGHRYFVTAGSNSDPSDLKRLSTDFFRPLYQAQGLDISKFDRMEQPGQFFRCAK